jgi:putative NADH-flavin reductase
MRLPVPSVLAVISCSWTRTSSISFEDHAVALVDELEQPKHLRRRFTVGY